jgi:hypothetical protein
MAIQYPIGHKPMLGKGSVLFDRFDANGNPTGNFLHLGNCSKFELDPKDDIAELYQSLYPTPTLIATAVKKRQPKLQIEGTDFNSDHLAIGQISAGRTELATTATTFTAEVLVSVAQAANAKGRFFRLANMNVDNVTTPPVLTQNAVVLVAGTDYTVADALNGLIYFPSSSSIDGTHAITATYHTLVGTFDQVAALTQNSISGHFLFVPDPADGEKIGCDVWRVNLFVNGKIGLIADDYGNWTLEGYILDDTANHPTSPFYLYTYQSAAPAAGAAE